MVFETYTDDPRKDGKLYLSGPVLNNKSYNNEDFWLAGAFCTQIFFLMWKESK